MELLAPAGGFESLKAAVENGADAVYIGAHNFSARNLAENFGDIAQAVSFAHASDVKLDPLPSIRWYATVKLLPARNGPKGRPRRYRRIYRPGPGVRYTAEASVSWRAAPREHTDDRLQRAGRTRAYRPRL